MTAKSINHLFFCFRFRSTEVIFVCILSFLMTTHDAFSQTPTYQDCYGAIPVCSDSITINFNHNGMGNYSNEIANVSTCYAPEQRSVWFTWTVQQSGILRYSINPVSANQDHDWTLFNLTNGTCSQLSTSSGASGAMVRSNTWGVNGANGSTGVSTPAGGSGTCNGPGTGNGPKFCADLAVTTGQRFLLHISNWTGTSYGFTIDFSSSTAVIYDTIPPQMDSITSSIECAAIDSLVVKFSENIKCDSTHTGDFQLSGPGGNHTITAVGSPICNQNGAYDMEYTLHFTPPITQIGNYKLKIIPGAGFVEDVCGNLDTQDSLEFYFNGLVEFDLTGTEPVCNGVCTGTLYASPTVGAAPFSFAWNNSLSNDSAHNNVCAGTYIVTVTDDLDCSTIDSIVIGEPDLLIANIDTTFGVSCPNSIACDGDASASAVGGTPPYYYLWQSGEVLSNAQGLCPGTNYVIITDVNNCKDTTTTNVWIPDSIETIGFGDTTICITNYAGITAATTGGTAPYYYVWTESALTGSVISTSVSTSVHPETDTYYYVSSTDENGCIGGTSEVLVRVRNELNVDIPRPDTICPYDEHDIIASGIGGDSLYTYAWSTGDFGPTITVSPDTSKWYYVTVSDYCGTPTYVDSVFQQVGGYSPIRAVITVEDDSLCPGESIYLIARGYGGFHGPNEFRFNWNHTSDSNRIQFTRPSKRTDFIVGISDLCLSKRGTDTVTIYVDEMVKPVVAFNPKEACAENDVVMTIEHRHKGYQYFWNLGDETTQTTVFRDSFLLHKYDDVGCYDISLNYLSDFGCSDTSFYPCAIKVLQKPKAAFTHSPDFPTSIHPIISFEEKSQFAINWQWSYDGNTNSNGDVFDYEFEGLQNEYSVQLIAWSEDGCSDTSIHAFPYIVETTLYYPNSFTPNGDGINDQFGIEGEFIRYLDFELVVYDRWGHQVFGSTRPDRKWDGTNSNGDILPTGAYPFSLRYRNEIGELKVISNEVIISLTGIKKGL